MSWDDDNGRRTFWLPHRLLDHLRGEAERQGVSASYLVRLGIEHVIGPPPHERPADRSGTADQTPVRDDQTADSHDDTATGERRRPDSRSHRDAS